MASLFISAAISSIVFLWIGASSALAAANDCIPLLEKISGQDCIPVGGTLGAFEAYFNLVYPWVGGLAAGIAVVHALWGGFTIMTSGGDTTARGAGVTRIRMAIMGLILLLLSGLILRTLNPTFFT